VNGLSMQTCGRSLARSTGGCAACLVAAAGAPKPSINPHRATSVMTDDGGPARGASTGSVLREYENVA
jgi:hypothetical protein